MWERDHAAQAAGVEIVEAARGRARARLTVRGDMVNGHGIAHGGYVFLLADTAFAYACNTERPTTVARSCLIEFLAPGREREGAPRVAGRADVLRARLPRHLDRGPRGRARDPEGVGLLAHLGQAR